ncbi:MAG: sodium:proton antiporter [Vicinamibacteria bacterium]
MELFESVLTLAAVAIALLQVSRTLAIPYPTMLAVAGVVVAALPWSPTIAIDPALALALFIAPALLDAAYDLPPREMRRHWRALLSLAGVAPLVTTAAVAWAAVALTGMSLPAAIALGAIVAPPDAAAAAAILGRLPLPRAVVRVLKGESLLNDAVALLVFTAAVGVATREGSMREQLPSLALAVPAGLVVGFLAGKAYVALAPRLAGTLGGRFFEFVSTFAVWVVAERLHLSAILAVVAFAVVVARHMPSRQSALDRVHSYSVWETTVFVLNVLAFLLIGLQAREIVLRLKASERWEALGFGFVVLAVVIAVRVAWVLAHHGVELLWARRSGETTPAGFRHAFLVSWCGMRGLVTLAIALALPARFPSRDLIVLSAFTVVLGTLVVQGLTLAPLIRRLRLPRDDSFAQELMGARETLLAAAVASLDGGGEAAARVRADYEIERAANAKGGPEASGMVRPRLSSLLAQRVRLAELRRDGAIDDDVFHALEQELDFAELAASPPGRLEMVEG